MNKEFCRIIFSLTAAVLLIFCACFAEVYDDPDMCFSFTQDGWIKDIMNAFEIKASGTNLYEFDAFSALTFAGELEKTDFDIIRDPLKPFDGAAVFFDKRTFEPVSSDAENGIRIIMGAVLDPEKTDPAQYSEYASLKYSVIDRSQNIRHDILIWANTFGKQIQAEGIFWLIELPAEYSKTDIAKYGSVLNYLTRFVYETGQSSLDFKTLLASMETDESGRFRSRDTRQLTGRGYSIGLIADPAFVFLTIADIDAVLFRDSGSVIEYYGKVCGNTGVCGR